MLYSQVVIKGTIRDQESKESVSGAMISILPMGSNQILAFTNSDLQGNFVIKYAKEPRIILLKIKHLSYKDYEQAILLTDAANDTVRIDALLLPKSLQLEEVEIKVKPPIIVEKDTIIYDISHWQQAGDETLESVLQKMPGFRVRADGELEFEGKVIDKVLINGKEFNSTGAAILTRSLDPSRIDNVEIRKKEKSKKLKNSLLDSKDIMVLDIKLKDDLDHSFFGRLRATAGWQDKALPGAYANLFRFGKKMASHVFAERDLLGNQEISIEKIRNIGSEAIAKLFSLPADFSELMAREGYNQELYGFKDYSRSDRNIAGLTSNYTLSPRSDLFFGSYTTFNRVGVNLSSDWLFLQGENTASFVQQRLSNNLESLNKAEWRYDTESLKARVDINLTYFNKDRTQTNDLLLEQLFYNFRQQDSRLTFTSNMFLEQEISSSLGWQFKSSYTKTRHFLDHRLAHNDSAYLRFLQDERGALVEDFGQDNPTE